MILILTAMPQELEAILDSIDHPAANSSAGRKVVQGKISGHPVALSFSRWGKVAAASTAAHLITVLKPRQIVFSGIAGALIDDLAIGDVVFADDLYQHDLDASPFYPPAHIPLLERSALPADRALTASLRRAMLDGLGSRAPRTLVGDVATGDQVIGTSHQRERVSVAVPTAVCVDMEGAAVAQVCFEFGVPFACVRMISDRADESLAPAKVFSLARRSGERAAVMLRHWLSASGQRTL
ncbi:MAG: 5'-methylthioadenosine/adenosylhomocysteine nucleosidase [Gammaproteobacteria bacterium]|nr:5'-methylthioadenosine/adenosylhomocysteine nucleosidase [Gammaproteobacteria bacterium]